MTDEKLREIFRHFDVDDTDFISRDNIKEAMGKLGHNLTDDEIDKAIGVHDVKHDGKINFEEFKNMFIPNDEWINHKHTSATN